jgi:energy-coupling factor transport system permease protein
MHKLDPRSKGVWVLCISILAFIFQDLVLFILLVLAVFPFLMMGKMVKEFFRGLSGLTFLIVFILIINSWVRSLNYAFVVILRIIVLMMTFSLYFQTTLPEDLTQSLLSLRVSYPNAFALSLAFRFVPTMAQETEIIMDAQKSRGHQIQEGGIIQQIRNLLPLLIPLLLNSLRRAYHVAEALESRGFGSRSVPEFYFPLKFKHVDSLLILISLIMLVGGIILQINLDLLPSWLQWVQWNLTI